MRVATRTDSAVSMNATGNGSAFKIDHMDGFAVSVQATASSGTLGGTFKLQGTATDPFTNNVNNTANPDAVWDDIPGSVTTVSTTSTATYSYNCTNAYYRGVRLVWTRTGGLGSYTAYWSAKGPQS